MSGGPPLPSLRILRWTAYSAPCLVVIWLYSGFYLEVPLFDEWSLLPVFEKIAAGELELADLLERQNRVHVNLVPKLIFAPLAFWSDWSIKLEVYLNMLLVASTFVLCERISSRRTSALHDANRFAANLVTALLLFSLVQSWNWTWGYALVIFIINFFVVLGAFTLLPGREKDVLAKTLVASALCWLATFSHADGALIWIALLPALVLLVWRSPRRHLALTVWLVSGALCWCAFLWGYEGRPAGSSLVDEVMSGPLDLTLYYLNLLGIPLGSFLAWLDPRLGAGHAFAPFGLALVLAYIALMIHFVRRDRWRTRGDVAAWGAVGLFVLLYGVVNTVARFTLGEVVAMANSMYATATGLLPVAVIQLAAVYLIEARESAAGMDHESGQAAAASRRPPLGSWLVMATTGLITVSVGAGWAHGLAERIPERRASLNRRHCLELTAHLAQRNMCHLRLTTFDGGVERMAALGFRTLRKQLPFVTRADPSRGEIEPYRDGDWKVGSPSVLHVRGWVAASDPVDAAGTVFLSLAGEDVLFGIATGYTVSAEEPRAGRIEWTAKVPAAMVRGASETGILAWRYDAAGGRILQLGGRLEVPHPPTRPRSGH